MNLYELIENFGKEAKQHGHILDAWKKYGGGNSYYGFGRSSDTNAYTSCLLCKKSFSIDNTLNEPVISTVEDCIHNSGDGLS